MDPRIIGVSALVVLGLGYVLVVLVREFNSIRSPAVLGSNRPSDHLRDLAGQRRAGANVDLVLAAAEESEVAGKNAEAHVLRLTLEDKLRYAKWPLTPIQFRFIQFMVTICLFIPTYFYATIFIQILAVVLGPITVSSVLNHAINKRVKAFDRDYAVMLMQFVSLLKTGINPVTGLSSVARALDQGSLVRAEIELMMNRMRLGMNEEQAIHAFGEDIAHPEIELFVQSLLLHTRIGGTLSKTLERLARQVRKRQQFREQAVAAIGMERMSIYSIAAILTALMVYMVLQAPDLILPGFADPMGKMISQGGLALIIFGFYWSTQVTKLKI